MSSWFARTISSTLDLGEAEEKDENDVVNEADTGNSSPVSPGRGVKEDLSELTKTVTRQFWGVASFLAPPVSSDSGSPPEGSDTVGIRSDIAEIGGRFKSGIWKLSDNMAAVSEMASNFLQLDLDEENDFSAAAAVGITDIVIDFVRDIVMHPDTWLDFPLPDNHQDFDISDAQQEHALAVERLVPRLAALRMELCPGYMSEAWFWKIYFILLHPRLDQRDAEVLSTPQIMEARALLTHNIKKPTNANPEQEWSSRGASYMKDSINSQEEEHLSVPSIAELEPVPIKTSACEPVDFPITAVPETEKHPVTSSEIQIVDKAVIEEEIVKQKKDQNLHSASTSNIVENNDEDDADDWLKKDQNLRSASASNIVENNDEDDADDDWLKEESSGIVGSAETTIPIHNDDDVSFSDLEEDEQDVRQVTKK